MGIIKIFPAGILEVDEMFTDFGAFFLFSSKIEIYRYLANFDRPDLLAFKYWERVIVVFRKNESGIIDQKLRIFKLAVEEMGMTPQKALNKFIESDDQALWGY